MKWRNRYFYICEECKDIIPTRIDTIKNKTNPICAHCVRVKTALHMTQVRTPDYIEKFRESRQYNLIGQNSLYYGLYELGLSDKEIGDITGRKGITIANWRWDRNLSPNFEETDKVNKDGTFKPKNIKGSRDIYTHVRDGLYQWKYTIMERDNFKCQKCGNYGHNEIHHDKEKFIDIVKKFLPNRNIEEELTWDEKKVIANKIIQYHYDNNVSGITLCNKCHVKLKKD